MKRWWSQTYVRLKDFSRNKFQFDINNEQFFFFFSIFTCFHFFHFLLTFFFQRFERKIIFYFDRWSQTHLLYLDVSTFLFLQKNNNFAIDWNNFSSNHHHNNKLFAWNDEIFSSGIEFSLRVGRATKRWQLCTSHSNTLTAFWLFSSVCRHSRYETFIRVRYEFERETQWRRRRKADFYWMLFCVCF